MVIFHDFRHLLIANLAKLPNYLEQKKKEIYMKKVYTDLEHLNFFKWSKCMIDYEKHYVL